MSISEETAMGFGDRLKMMRSQLNKGLRRIPEWPVYIIGVVPPSWLLWQGLSGGLGVDPVKAMEHQMGLWALQLLLATLAITPIMRFAKINIFKFRRPLGLLAALYVLLHLLVWVVFDLQMRWAQVGADLIKRPYIIVGFVAFVLLIPLAATSWTGAARRMGARAWRRLHMLIYVILPLGAVHFVMQEKVWGLQAITYLTLAMGIVALRLLWIRRM
jgi:sulfoxide reductase heme-binding subunit YedZ